jgi:hypothetical protein
VIYMLLSLTCWVGKLQGRVYVGCWDEVLEGVWRTGILTSVGYYSRSIRVIFMREQVSYISLNLVSQGGT